MISSVVAAIVNVILNYVGLNYCGYEIAAYTTLLSYVVLALIQAIVAINVCKKQTIVEFPYNNRWICLISLSTIIVCMLILLLYDYSMIRWGLCILLGVILIIRRRDIIRFIKKE